MQSEGHVPTAYMISLSIQFPLMPYIMSYLQFFMVVALFVHNLCLGIFSRGRLDLDRPFVSASTVQNKSYHSLRSFIPPKLIVFPLSGRWRPFLVKDLNDSMGSSKENVHLISSELLCIPNSTLRDFVIPQKEGPVGMRSYCLIHI